MQCKKCGSENRDDAKFCRKCGTPLIKRKRKSGISKVISFLLVILALASIAVIGHFIVRGVNLPSNDAVGDSSNQLAIANLRDYSIKVEDEESAREAIRSLGGELAIGNSSHQLGSCRIDDACGWTYYRFKQEVDGYEVQGRTLTLGVNEHGIAESLASNAISLEEGKREAVIGRADAEGAIKSIVGEECDVNAAELVIYPTGDNRGILCYRSYVSTPYGAKLVFVSAEDGSLVGQQALSFTEQVEGRGKTKASPSTEVSFMTEHDGATYSLFDKERAITVFDAKGKNVNATPAYTDQTGKQYKYDGESEKLVALDDGSTRDYGDDCEYIGLYLSTRGVIGRLAVATSGSTYWSDKTAVSAMHNVSVAHDFYASILGRNGFSGATPHNMSVCINTFSQTNSQWGRTGEDAVIRFSFNDSIQLDTAAHEFTHDVEQSISAMDYEGESGALMEATSDVFAELAEDFADDGQMNNTCDWKQSDCRDLGNPEKSPIAERGSGKNKNAHATRYQQEDMYWASTTPEYDKNGDTTNDYGHVHNNSTVISHAAYLMCNGGIEGEGLTTRELADVLYATFFTIPSDCDFAQYAGWVQCKARSMLTPSKVKRVEAAFKAVGISPWLIAYVEPIKDASDDSASSNNDDLPRKLITAFHVTYSSKKWPDQAYEEWVNASYDKQGRITHKEITRETSFNGWDGEPAYSLDFEYDAAGDLQHVSGVESPGASYSTQVNWNLGYEEGNATLRASGTEGSDSRYINDTYDADGNLVNRDYLIRTGQVLENGTLTLSYDAYGRISGQSANKGYNGDQSSMSRYDTSVTYDGSSRIASIEVLDSCGKLFSRRTYEYDDAGRLTSRNHFYDGGSSNLTVKQSYSYDEDGRLSSIDQTEGDGWWAPAKATFTTDEDGSIVTARIEGEDYTRTYEVEYVTISTSRGQEPFNAVDLTNPVNPEIYNELWVSHANLDPTPYDESAFLRENRRWLELHNPSEVAQESVSESAGDGTTDLKGDTTIESTDSVEASATSSEFDGKQYWVVFTEGFRNGRVEASSFDVSSGSPILIWDRNVTVSGATVDGKVSQFRLKEAGDWEKIGEYGIPTDWALEILASNVPVVDSSGNRVDVPETY